MACKDPRMIIGVILVRFSSCGILCPGSVLVLDNVQNARINHASNTKGAMNCGIRAVDYHLEQVNS